MPSSRYVGNAKELKKALNDKTEHIVITDKKLAFAVRVIKSITYAKLAIVATGAGVAAVGFWNPAGWGAGAATAVTASGVVASGLAAAGGAAAASAAGITGGTAAVIVASISVLGVLGLAALAMHKDYALDIDTSASGKVDNSGEKPEVGGSGAFKMSLKRNAK
ncbi:TPA: hypothetical protein MXU26_004832 [Pseudomonas aeruginosa]|jgi:hypothetical protein|uniref:hypothetical protein n=1 Tax=Pseudomonadaceae TaxID=135621 RepID=UPI00053CF04D|nr:MULTISPECIES: hypothetical protein [Pseudomonadaceae]KSO70059.1 hypothetical protein APA94_21565 [Pseudomonas aeruginosa]MBH9038566.1 hypothetical protein [Pseudomonas aeruginosa]MCU9225960.1 hypothetical protein [Pseudomonas aeruginosa]MDI9727866.1 hypothetical protein [Stutzerimonas stutzeri]MDI9747528.1 hypothetical protein [Stutzerimonas stutzeri]